MNPGSILHGTVRGVGEVSRGDATTLCGRTKVQYVWHVGHPLATAVAEAPRLGATVCETCAKSWPGGVHGFRLRLSEGSRASEINLDAHYVCWPDSADDELFVINSLDGRAFEFAADAARAARPRDRVVRGFDARAALTGSVKPEAKYAVEWFDSLTEKNERRAFDSEADALEFAQSAHVRRWCWTEKVEVVGPDGGNIAVFTPVKSSPPGGPTEWIRAYIGTSQVTP